MSAVFLPRLTEDKRVKAKQGRKQFGGLMEVAFSLLLCKCVNVMSDVGFLLLLCKCNAMLSYSRPRASLLLHTNSSSNPVSLLAILRPPPLSSPSPSPSSSHLEAVVLTRIYHQLPLFILFFSLHEQCHSRSKNVCTNTIVFLFKIQPFLWFCSKVVYDH